jgi:hypothetical protein
MYRAKVRAWGRQAEEISIVWHAGRGGVRASPQLCLVIIVGDDSMSVVNPHGRRFALATRFS